MIKEAIVLAGGKGTRLRSVVADVPKPMAEVGDKPFLDHLLQKIISHGIERIVLSVGYKKEVIEDYFGNSFQGAEIVYAVEEEALGTGGAIKLALESCIDEQVFVFNGDTYLDLNLEAFATQHLESGKSISLALKEMNSPDRYGTVEVKYSRITDFREKQTGVESGLINAGVYALKSSLMQNEVLPTVFSFESEILEKKKDNWVIGAFTTNGFFVDIGVPEDYRRAHAYFSMPNVDSGWTLFLDRDGVINVRKIGDYIRSVEEFEFLPGALEAIAGFSKIFKRIVVVTNQQGIGKGLMTAQDLNQIHRFMMDAVESAGGKIDKAYFCPALHKENDQCRKPNPGMAFKAKEDFRDIEFDQCLMIGDSLSDIEFASNAGMPSVFITPEPYKYEVKLTDVQAINLLELESYLRRR